MSRPSISEIYHIWVCKNCGGEKFTIIDYKNKTKIICKKCKRKIYKINKDFTEVANDK